jgi:hypothetical protein
MVDRTDRDLETRDSTLRATSWSPPQILPTPNPRPGWEHRYVRVSIFGDPDPTNVSQRLREGWEPCRVEDYPEIMTSRPGLIKPKGNVEIGGLMLCRMPSEMFKQREAYYDRLARTQLESVDQNYMRENDPRMPLMSPERRHTVTFGRRR